MWTGGDRWEWGKEMKGGEEGWVEVSLDYEWLW